MGLPASTRYLAYDIHAPRVSFLNAYFQMEGLTGEAILRDILVEPPTDTADAAFLFKEAHRFEEREAGCNRALWRALKVRTLYVSLPPFSMTGRHDLTIKNRKLVERSLSGETWRVRELNFPNEQVFVIEK
jgi:16S rRNA (guanine(1405)-N(7))-methyltransferase